MYKRRTQDKDRHDPGAAPDKLPPAETNDLGNALRKRNHPGRTTDADASNRGAYMSVIAPFLLPFVVVIVAFREGVLTSGVRRMSASKKFRPNT